MANKTATKSRAWFLSMEAIAEEVVTIKQAVAALQTGKVGWLPATVIIGGMFLYLVMEINALSRQNAEIMATLQFMLERFPLQ